METEKPIVTAGAGKPLAELTDLEIEMIEDGLQIPSEMAWRSMAREIRKWRGVKDPDAP